jgi:uncharacterized protein YgiM (DUF1202 family)
VASTAVGDRAGTSIPIPSDRAATSAGARGRTRSSCPVASAAPAPAAAPVLRPKGGVRAVIDDPDGWTNVRSGPGVSSPVLTQVVDGDVFTATVSRDEWGHVTTKDGTSGFMHRSRIRVLD